MNRTFYTLKQNVGKMIGDTSSETLSLIGGYINDRLMEVYRRTNLTDTHRGDYSFTTVANTEDYVLPQDFGKEISVVDKTNKRPLSRINTKVNADYNYAVMDSAGTTSGYIILDKTVMAQPASASTLTVTSSSASDTSKSVYVKGFNASGYEVYETINLNGTNNVTSANTYLRVATVSKSDTTVGTVTVTAGATTIAVLSPEQLESRCKVIRLVQIPNTAFTIEMNYIQRMLPLTQNYDYPIIPCEDILEAGATADAWRFKRQFAKAADMDIVFEKRLANLIYDEEAQPNKINLFQPRTYRSGDAYGANVDDSRRYGVF